jgi:hypothetical protein
MLQMDVGKKNSRGGGGGVGWGGWVVGCLGLVLVCLLLKRTVGPSAISRRRPELFQKKFCVSNTIATRVLS